MTDRVTDKEKCILALIRDNPDMSYQEMADKIKLSRKTVSKYIKSFKDKGVIRRIGSDRKGSWEIVND